MKYNVKFYDPTSNDFAIISDFVLKRSDFIAQNTSWSYQRFVDWRYGHIEKENEFCSKTLIKFVDESNEIFGIAINEDGNNCLTLLTTTESPELYQRLLEDAVDYLMVGHETIYFELSERQTMEMDCIRKMGFVEVGGSQKMRYALESMEIDTIKSKDGFRIISLAEEPMYEQQGRLRASAFQGRLEISEEEVAERLAHIEIMKQSPTFNPSTDILVVDSFGKAVAGCEPLVNFHTKDAEIERVCTHIDFRNQGFSRMVITEAMRRLKDEGIKYAYLSGWNDTTIHLYKSFGPHQSLKIYNFKYER